MDLDYTICKCRGVKIGEIVNSVKSGNDSFDKVKKDTTLGTGCGGCVSKAQTITENIINEVEQGNL